MTDEDIEYIRRLLKIGGILQSPVLELGAGYGGNTCRSLIEAAGLEYVATDMRQGEGVDYVADFEDAESLRIFNGRVFGSVLQACGPFTITR